jgi:hypothetical protein
VRVHYTTLKSGIIRTKEFERKGLARFAVNFGAKAGRSLGLARARKSKRSSLQGGPQT